MTKCAPNDRSATNLALFRLAIRDRLFVSMPLRAFAPTPPIPAGGQAVLTITYAPKALGKDSAILTFPQSGPCQDAAVSVTLVGLGIKNTTKEVVSAGGYSLDQSYPNPTNGNTSFTYVTPKETEVRLTLVDLTGKLIRTLVTGNVSQGEHTLTFDASNLPSGLYVYVLESGSTRLARQMVLAK